MARIIPSDLTEAYLAEANTAEIATLRLLKKSLPNDYTIFHSVHWSRTHKGSTSFGELDFVILNKSGDILVIEQKNGSLSESSQGLVKAYESRDRNVAQQLHRSLDNIREKLNGVLPSGCTLKIEYLFYCPDYRVKNLNAAGLDRARIVDAVERSNLCRLVERLLGPGSENALAEIVEKFFCHSFEVVPDIHAHVDESDRAFTRLSEGLSEIVSCIEMAPLRLRIRGTAGCGKSQVALGLFRRAVEEGKKPLLVCFNRPLRERLAALAPKGGVIQTWYGLCDQFLTAAGQKPDFGNFQLSAAFWRDVQDKVTAAPMRQDWIFDTIIVDEGQDFEVEWFDILGLFHKPGGDFIWLEDQSQNVFMRTPVPLEGFVTFNAKRNYRTPESIARYIKKVLPYEFESTNDMPGLGVEIHRYKEMEEQSAMLNSVVVNLLKQGFSYSDIAVLSFRGTGNSTFSGVKKVGSHTLKNFSGEYDMFGNQIFSEGKLLFESIGRFKGQQAPAVVLTDIDPKDSDLERAQRLLFCGMTRATVR